MDLAYRRIGEICNFSAAYSKKKKKKKMGMVKVQVGCFCKLNRKMMLLTPSVWDLDSKITDIGDSGSLRV